MKFAIMLQIMIQFVDPHPVTFAFPVAIPTSNDCPNLIFALQNFILHGQFQFRGVQISHNEQENIIILNHWKINKLIK